MTDTEIPAKNDVEELQSGELQGVPDWLPGIQGWLGLRESVPEHRDASCSSHELLLEPRAKVGYRVNTTYFLISRQDRNCDFLFEDENNEGFLQKTHRYSRAQSGNFGDLITADHKNLSEGCESRHNHRCAVVVQDLATQWIQSYPCKQKLPRISRRT